MMTLKKRGLLVCLILALVFSFTGAAAQSTTPVYLGDSTAITTVTLRIYTVEDEILFDGPVAIVDQAPTVYMALKAAAEANDMVLEVSGEDTPDSMFLNGINDLLSENPVFWMYYINQASAELGMGTQPVADGDVIEFIYEDWSAGYVEVPAA